MKSKRSRKNLEIPSSSNDLADLSYNLLTNINFKIGFLLYIFYIILNTDIFHEMILYKIDPSCYCQETCMVSNKGFFIIGLLLVLFYLLIDVLDKNELI